MPYLGVEPLETKSRNLFCLLLPGKEGWDANLMSEELFLAWGPVVAGQVPPWPGSCSGNLIILEPLPVPETPLHTQLAVTTLNLLPSTSPLPGNLQ